MEVISELQFDRMWYKITHKQDISEHNSLLIRWNLLILLKVHFCVCI